MLNIYKVLSKTLPPTIVHLILNLSGDTAKYLQYCYFTDEDVGAEKFYAWSSDSEGKNHDSE